VRLSNDSRTFFLAYFFLLRISKIKYIKVLTY